MFDPKSLFLLFFTFITLLYLQSEQAIRGFLSFFTHSLQNFRFLVGMLWLWRNLECTAAASHFRLPPGFKLAATQSTLNFHPYFNRKGLIRVMKSACFRKTARQVVFFNLFHVLNSTGHLSNTLRLGRWKIPKKNSTFNGLAQVGPLLQTNVSMFRHNVITFLSTKGDFKKRVFEFACCYRTFRTFHQVETREIRRIREIGKHCDAAR